MTRAYLVTLTGAPELPIGERIAAEVRFVKALERIMNTDDRGIAVELGRLMEPHEYLAAVAGPGAAVTLPHPLEAAHETATAEAWRGLAAPHDAHFRMSFPSDRDGFVI